MQRSRKIIVFIALVFFAGWLVPAHARAAGTTAQWRASALAHQLEQTFLPLIGLPAHRISTGVFDHGMTVAVRYRFRAQDPYTLIGIVLHHAATSQAAIQYAGGELMAGATAMGTLCEPAWCIPHGAWADYRDGTTFVAYTVDRHAVAFAVVPNFQIFPAQVALQVAPEVAHREAFLLAIASYDAIRRHWPA